MSVPVHFFCRNPKHRGHPDIISNAITINEGEWAFCPAGAVDEHVWERTQSANLDALRHPLAREERVSA
jgi:hypothetical protein